MKRFLPFVAILLFTQTIHAQGKYWIKNSGDWTDPNGWDPAGVPPAGSRVAIRFGAEVTISTDVRMSMIQVEEGATLRVGSTGQLHLNSGTTWAINLLDQSHLIVDGQMMIGDLAPIGGHGINAFYSPVIFTPNIPDITINTGGKLSISNTVGAAILLFCGGTLTNNGSIEIAKMGHINGSRNGFPWGMYLFETNFTNTGVITVDNVLASANPPGQAVGIAMAGGSLTNTNKILLGQTGAIEGAGLYGIKLTNSGEISIGMTSTGILFDTLINTATGRLRVGQGGNVANRGIDASNADIINDGLITIDNIAAGDGIYLNAGTLVNDGDIMMGNSGTINGIGLRVGSSTINNKNVGSLDIRNCSSGIDLSATTFNNAGDVLVGGSTTNGFRIWSSSTVTNTGNIETTFGQGGSDIQGDAVLIDNSVFNNNTSGDMVLNRVDKNGIHLISNGRFENRGKIKMQTLDSLPLLMESSSRFTNYGSFEAPGVIAYYGGGITVKSGSFFSNEPGSKIVINRLGALSSPSLYIHGNGSLFRNRANLILGDGLPVLSNDVIQVDQQAAFINERDAIVQFTITQKNGLVVSNDGDFTNRGTLEFYNIGESPIYAFGGSTINNEGIIKTGLGSSSSKESFRLDNINFHNRPHAEIYIEQTGATYNGITLTNGTIFENESSISWGKTLGFQGATALQLINGGVLDNRPGSLLEFVNCSNDAIVCDAVAGQPQSSNFLMNGLIKFGTITGRGFYNSDPNFQFSNIGRMETMPGGKMNLQANVDNEGPQSELYNADGTVTLAYPFSNKGIVTSGGIINSQGLITNSNRVINNGTWNMTGIFNNNTGGLCQGTGTFQGALFRNNLGFVSPGNSPGCLSFASGFTNQSNGGIQVEVNGKNNACVEFDRINVTGTATISGQLNVTFGGTYTPVVNDKITILKSSSLSGVFSGHNLPNGWTILYNTPAAGDITLSRIATLPLHLLKFSAKKDGNEARISWTTTDEVNTSHFELERNDNGSQFQKIATIASINAAGEYSYEFTDQQPLAGINHYRLKMVDIDETYTYSWVVSVDMDKPQAIVSSIYPNPATDIVNVVVAESSNDLSIQLISLDGKILQTKRFAVRGTYPLDVASLPPGIYFIKINNGETYKLIKQ